jgi:hypothetical protein
MDIDILVRVIAGALFFIGAATLVMRRKKTV